MGRKNPSDDLSGEREGLRVDADRRIGELDKKFVKESVKERVKE